MKAVILALLLSATALAAQANLIVLPTPKGCKQAEVDGNTKVVLACAKMAKSEPVNLACPIQGGCTGKTSNTGK